MPDNIKQAEVLLVLDGHFSRHCPEAIKLLQFHRVAVLVLPGHCTHLLQPFDVVLAPVLKSNFKRFLTQGAQAIENSGRQFESEAARVRFLYVESFLKAWYAAATPANCARSFEKTGIFPPCPEQVLHSPFVVDQLVVQEENTLINNNLLTHPAVLTAVCHEKPLNRDPLPMPNYDVPQLFPDFKPLVDWMRSNDQRQGRLLTAPPSLFWPMYGKWQLIATFLENATLPVDPAEIIAELRRLASDEHERAQEVIHEIVANEDEDQELVERAIEAIALRFAYSMAADMTEERVADIITIVSEQFREKLTELGQMAQENPELQEHNLSSILTFVSSEVTKELRKAAGLSSEIPHAD